MGDAFTPEQVARCTAAMDKDGPISALRTLASGRVVVEVQHGRIDDVLIDRFDGRRVRDPDHPTDKIGLAGSWPLYAAGMIDRFGVVTEAGRAWLVAHPAPKVPS